MPVCKVLVFSPATLLVIVATNLTFAVLKLAPKSTCNCLPDGVPVKVKIAAPSWLLPERETRSPTAPETEPAVIICKVKSASE